MNGQKILLIENFASDFYKARLPLAIYLIEKGYDVHALIPTGEYVDMIRQAGIKVIGYDLNRKDKGINQLIQLVKIYRSVIRENDIDIIHSFRFQPNLLNVLANSFNKRRIFLHITGLGIAFSNSSFSYLILRFVSQIIFQVKLIRADTVIVQNNDDARDIWLSGFWKKKLQVIHGSGVNTSFFEKSRFDKVILRKDAGVSNDDRVFICVTRLLWEKGIKEMVDAFTFLKLSHKNIRLWIVGWSDKDNPRHVADAYIEQFAHDNNIIFMGKKENIRELLAMADVFIYPSYYREGIPRGILEALSMSLPVLTTHMPGCNLTVKPGKNGYLIAPRSSIQIIGIVEKIIQEDRLAEMGHESRALAISKFSDVAIFSEIERLYKK